MSSHYYVAPKSNMTYCRAQNWDFFGGPLNNNLGASKQDLGAKIGYFSVTSYMILSDVTVYLELESYYN